MQELAQQCTAEDVKKRPDSATLQRSLAALLKEVLEEHGGAADVKTRSMEDCKDVGVAPRLGSKTKGAPGSRNTLESLVPRLGSKQQKSTSLERGSGSKKQSASLSAEELSIAEEQPVAAKKASMLRSSKLKACCFAGKVKE